MSIPHDGSIQVPLGTGEVRGERVRGRKGMPPLTRVDNMSHITRLPSHATTGGGKEGRKEGNDDNLTPSLTLTSQGERRRRRW